VAQRKKGLGRGLDALLSDYDPPAAGAVESERDRSGASPFSVPVSAVLPNQHQPRRSFEPTALAELAQSIQAQGIIQPIVVRHGESAGTYVILAGERRWRAAQQAGLSEIPVVVHGQELDAAGALQLALVENLQRTDLNVLEEAQAYRELREQFGMSQEQIAERVGKSRSAVANHLRLLRLPEQVLEALRSGSLSAGQARPLLRLPRSDEQSELAARIVRDGLSAREVEALVAQRLQASEPRPVKKAPRPDVDVHTRQATERLTRALQTRVEIRRGRRGGQVRIHFHSEDELMRIYERLAHDQEKTSVQE
jgi:ParB family chromosome partitioning protein